MVLELTESDQAAHQMWLYSDPNGAEFWLVQKHVTSHLSFEPCPIPVRKTQRKHTEPITTSVYKPCITHLINLKCIFDALKRLFDRRWILSLTLKLWDYRSGLPQSWCVSWEWDPKIYFLTNWTFHMSLITKLSQMLGWRMSDHRIKENNSSG